MTHGVTRFRCRSRLRICRSFAVSLISYSFADTRSFDVAANMAFSLLFLTTMVIMLMIHAFSGQNADAKVRQKNHFENDYGRNQAGRG